MKKIAIYCIIKGVEQDVDFSLLNDWITIDLNNELSGNKPLVANILPIIIRCLQEHSITQDEPFELYIAGSNSVCFAIPFFLTYLKYQYICSATIENPDFIEKQILEYQDIKRVQIQTTNPQPVYKNSTDLYVMFSGSNQHIIKNNHALSNQINYKIKLIAMDLTIFNEIYNINNFKRKIQEFCVDELSNFLGTAIHIISEIPSIGMMELGHIMATTNIKNSNIYIYNHVNYVYSIGDIMSGYYIHKLAQQIGTTMSFISK